MFSPVCDLLGIDEKYPTRLFARCWAFVAVCEWQPVSGGRQRSCPYSPIAEAIYTIHVVYSINQAAAMFKICDAITKNTQKRAALNVK